jgi:DNA-binding transcriptional LysR family regulator
MLEGRADMLLCHHHPAASNRLDPAAFRSIRLGSDMLVPVSIPVDGNPRFALPGGADGPPPYLQFDEQSGMGRILEATGIIQDSGVALRPVFRSHLASVLLHMARNGRGIAWSPLSLCEEDLRTGRLVRAGDDRWAVPFDIMLFRPRARRNAAVEGFWQRLVESAAVDAD